MKWRVMVVKTFDIEDEARDAWHDVKMFWPKGGTADDDHGKLHKCYHDETPPRPCEVVEELS